MTLKIYQLQRHGSLLTLKAFVADQDGVYRGIRLLLDTGATYTVLPLGFLKELGYAVQPSTPRIRIAAAGGFLQVPMVTIDQFSCLGECVRSFSVVSMDLPPSSVISGLLGMDFLLKQKAVINVDKAEIIIPTSAS
jgi:predicted aspartyl protease